MASKLFADTYNRFSNLHTIALRYFNVYGPKQDPNNPYSGVISIFIDRIMKNKTVTVNGGFQTGDFIYINDIINVIKKYKNKICIC